MPLGGYRGACRRKYKCQSFRDFVIYLYQRCRPTIYRPVSLYNFIQNYFLFTTSQELQQAAESLFFITWPLSNSCCQELWSHSRVISAESGGWPLIGREVRIHADCNCYAAGL